MGQVSFIQSPAVKQLAHGLPVLTTHLRTTSATLRAGSVVSALAGQTGAHGAHVKGGSVSAVRKSCSVRRQAHAALDVKARVSTSEVGTVECFKVTLSPQEATQWLRLLEIPNPNGDASVIVVEAVAIGSRAQEEGVQPGQRVLSVSHPVEKGTMWDLQPGASLSRVKDAVRVTRATEVDMVFTSDSVADDWWAERQKAEAEKEKEAAQNGGGGNRTGDGSLEQTLASPLLTSITAQLERLDSHGPPKHQEMGDGAAGASQESSGASPTIADQLEQQMSMDLSDEQRKVQAYQRRMARRKERQELEDARDDGPFFAIVFAAFVLPAAIILGVAIGSGYLDDLQSHQF